MTVREAGRLGGEVIRTRYGRDHFRRIGHRGGLVRVATDRAGMLAAARKGGEACRDMYGLDWFEKIGRAGGERVRDLYGKVHFAEAGRKGGLTAAANRRAKRAAP
jgi:hypothetical protein